MSFRDKRAPAVAGAVRSWAASLEITEKEALEMLGESREQLEQTAMALASAIAEGLILLRSGRTYEAKVRLERDITSALNRTILSRGPGPPAPADK